MKCIYKRILLKISGEALAGSEQKGIDFDVLSKIGNSIKKCVDLGVQIAIVVGGGNFWRGRSSGKMNRVKADYMGMMATVINSLGIADTLEQLNLNVRVQTAISIPQMAEFYITSKAIKHLEKGRVVIFGGGTGNPFFSTDTAAALRATEIGAEIIFKASTIDGVYDSDPAQNLNAKKYGTVSFNHVLTKNLKVIDGTAATLCKDNNIPILVFSIKNPENILSAVLGEDIGTIVN